jgi:hypothetical protein
MCRQWRVRRNQCVEKRGREGTSVLKAKKDKELTCTKRRDRGNSMLKVQGEKEAEGEERKQGVESGGREGTNVWKAEGEKRNHMKSGWRER